MPKAIAPEISTFPDEDAHLVGGHCGSCSATVFPVQDHCPNCGKGGMTGVALPRTGTLVTFTVQGFFPGYPFKGPGDRTTFEPFGMGLVQLGDVVRVEGRLTEADPAKLAFGMPVELTWIPFYTDDDGDEVYTFAFAPA
jgi:uncharacterized OB-fold protein